MAARCRWGPLFPPCSPPSLLRLGGELHGPSHVPVAQLEVGVEVLLRGDGGGVGVAQRLRDQRLWEQHGAVMVAQLLGVAQPWGPPSTLTPLLGPTCCSAMPRKDCSGVLLPARRGVRPSTAALCPPPPHALPLLLPLCWSERCSVRVRVISSTLDAP